MIRGERSQVKIADAVLIGQMLAGILVNKSALMNLSNKMPEKKQSRAKPRNYVKVNGGASFPQGK